MLLGYSSALPPTSSGSLSSTRQLSPSADVKPLMTWCPLSRMSVPTLRTVIALYLSSLLTPGLSSR